MIITIESTDMIVNLNGVPARLWEGETESGIPVHCFITRIAVSNDEDCYQFELELEECKAPSSELSGAYPARMVL